MDIQKVFQEFDEYYTNYDPYTEPLVALLTEMAEKAEAEGASSYEKKTRSYEILCRECPVHLFRESPFFFEISSGRDRHSWGGFRSQAGAFWHIRTGDLWLNAYGKELERDRAEGYLNAWNNPVGFDHHCPGYDNLLNLGLAGITAEAEKGLAACTDARKQDFYRCAIRANQALIGLMGRFAAEADRLAKEAQSEQEQAHYARIAQAAASLCTQPPQTFYEALSLMLFYRECVGSLEGIGISTFGQLDRMLLPYYARDLAEGRITYAEAYDMFCVLLTYTDVRFEYHHAYHETSTTFELGGCDADGNVIYNVLTEMILDAVIGIRATGTKINCRISKRHPRAYLEKIASVQAAALPVVMMHNDDVLIPARVRQGQDVRDARIYAGGGCHEIVLCNTEICTRADTWINVARILLDTVKKVGDCATYEEFYQEFLRDLRFYHAHIALTKNKYEKMWCEYAPLVLYSTSITGSLEKGMDVTEGGAKYNSTALSMVGTATAVDSLYAIKTIVFDEKRLTLSELHKVLEENFEGNELLRRYIVNRLPKYGTNDETLNRFSADVLSDIADAADGMTNARGGKYLPAFYPHSTYLHLGKLTGATPDGRRAGQTLARGASPSEFIPTESPLDLVHSLKEIDFTKFADSLCAEVTLPVMEDTEKAVQTLTAVIEGFLEAEGSSLQFNMLDQKTLIEAKKHPEQHGNLYVRVCGFSALFTCLEEDVQDEIIERYIR